VVVTDVLQEVTLVGFDRVFFAVAESAELFHRTIRPPALISPLAEVGCM
jgi:hypothetical protein